MKVFKNHGNDEKQIQDICFTGIGKWEERIYSMEIQI